MNRHILKLFILAMLSAGCHTTQQLPSELASDRHITVDLHFRFPEDPFMCDIDFIRWYADHVTSQVNAFYKGANMNASYRVASSSFLDHNTAAAIGVNERGECELHNTLSNIVELSSARVDKPTIMVFTCLGNSRHDLGVAHVGAIKSKDRPAFVTMGLSNNIFLDGLVLTHEIGHSWGLRHTEERQGLVMNSALHSTDRYNKTFTHSQSTYVNSVINYLAIRNENDFRNKQARGLKK